MYDVFGHLCYHMISIKGGSKCMTYFRVPSFFSQKIPDCLQVLSRSKKPFSKLYCKQFLHQKGDTKGVLKLQEYKTWKKLAQYNIKMLYILTFQVLSRFSAKFLVLSRFSDFF